MEILFLFALAVVNGTLAMSEIPLVTARRARLTRLTEQGDQAAGMAIRLGEDPNRFLCTVQIGITSIEVLSGIGGEAILMIPVTARLEGLGLRHETSVVVATGLVV